MGEYRLMNLDDLDEISYDEVDKILQRYEEARAIVEYQLKKFGSLDDKETYANFQDFMERLPQTREIKRRCAIAEQISEQNGVKS